MHLEAKDSPCSLEARIYKAGVENLSIIRQQPNQRTIDPIDVFSLNKYTQKIHKALGTALGPEEKIMKEDIGPVLQVHAVQSKTDEQMENHTIRSEIECVQKTQTRLQNKRNNETWEL